MLNQKISVIVPVYNGQEYLRGSLDSLVASTHNNLEIILIDNGSTDGSGRICDEYAKNDERITVLHTENRGVSAARNAGLEIATGDYIGFLDSDDTIEPDTYEYLLEAAVNNNAEVVQCGVFKEFTDKTQVVNSPKSPIVAESERDMKAEFWSHFAFSVWSKIYKSQVVRDIRFDTAYVIGEDLRYNFEALVKSRKTLLLPCPKYHYLQRTGSACNAMPSEKNLTSFRQMIKDAERDFQGYDNMTKFIFCEGMRNNAHVSSRIVLFGEQSFDGLFSEIRKDIKASFSRIKRARGLSAKDKLKLTLIAYFPKIYVFTLKMLKGSKGEEM